MEKIEMNEAEAKSNFIISQLKKKKYINKNEFETFTLYHYTNQVNVYLKGLNLDEALLIKEILKINFSNIKIADLTNPKLIFSFNSLTDEALNLIKSTSKDNLKIQLTTKDQSTETHQTNNNEIL